MNRKRVAAATVAALVLAFLLRTAPGYLLSLWVDGDPGAGVVPIYGSIGQTVSTLLYVTSALDALAPTAVGVALGYWIAREAVDDDARRTGLRTVGAVVVGLLGLLLPAAVVVAIVSDPFFVVTLLRPFTVLVVTFLGVVAGAGLEQFDLFDDGTDSVGETTDPAPSADADADAR